MDEWDEDFTAEDAEDFEVDGDGDAWVDSILKGLTDADLTS